MHMRVLFLVTVGMIGVGSVFAGGSAEDRTDPIGFGGVWPLGDITGEEGSNGAQLAIDEINAAGGLLGRPVELVVIDSEFSPEKGAAAIERLATIEEADFFVGGMSSGVHLGQIPAMKRYRKITMWTGADRSSFRATGFTTGRRTRSYIAVSRAFRRSVSSFPV